MNGFREIKEYINTKEPGYLFLRSDLMLFANLKKIAHSTVDMRVKLLREAGFLKFIAPGRYELVAKIPVDMTVEEGWLLVKKDNLAYIESRHNRKIRNSQKSR